ncbi:efflux RND transporter periplasmic adaptor subunit [Neorhodopirellula pilleata]|uniref:Multidrug efflux pump subunit AcrA n=1 Tax=Neorhodopirellula pilleata TaxID=2714738 RepID=A0A5C6A8F4_9BACT|nr:efflux RND transporter periplasmic adaptor subunit [Neorhodopirellula pilleata]TWT95578.1 Multidrug efflux pump subunit AcrA precursor [Neorhodopirellula pilleata]
MTNEFVWVRNKAFVIALVCTLPLIGCSRPANEFVAPPPPSVTVMLPIQQTITRYVEQNGETEAVGRAQVRARVRGFIEAIEFEAGQKVDVDTLLYLIEDDEYQATVNSMTAEVAAAEASISVAESQVLTAQAEADRASRDVDRQKLLREKQASSQAEYDQAFAADAAAKASVTAARSAVDSAKAVLKQTLANLEKAKLTLGYTRVTAPIAGQVTKTDLKLGNLVDNGTELATVVDDSRIYANFSISDRQLLELRKARGLKGQGRSSQEEWSNVPVFLRRETDDGFPFEGRLNYVDQEGVQATTGTASLRAIFENPSGQLFPGLFVRVRMPIAKQPDALIVPARAVLQDRVGAFVFVVGPDNLVQRRDVKVGEQDGAWTVVEDGLSGDDRVIIEGLQRARPDAQVQTVVKNADLSELPASFRTSLTDATEVDATEVDATEADTTEADTTEADAKDVAE